jgi:hypothetical protein
MTTVDNRQRPGCGNVKRAALNSLFVAAPLVASDLIGG